MIEPPRPCGDDVRDGDLGGQPDAGQVDVDHVAPGLLVHGVQAGAVAAEARVGTDDVEPAELGDALVDGGLERVVVAYVRLHGVDAPPQLLHLVDRLVEILGRRHGERDAVELLADVDRDDVGAFFGETDRMAAALSSRRAGDEGDLSFYASGHGEPRFWVDVLG